MVEILLSGFQAISCNIEAIGDKNGILPYATRKKKTTLCTHTKKGFNQILHTQRCFEHFRSIHHLHRCVHYRAIYVGSGTVALVRWQHRQHHPRWHSIHRKKCTTSRIVATRANPQKLPEGTKADEKKKKIKQEIPQSCFARVSLQPCASPHAWWVKFVFDW